MTASLKFPRGTRSWVKSQEAPGFPEKLPAGTRGLAVLVCRVRALTAGDLCCNPLLLAAQGAKNKAVAAFRRADPRNCPKGWHEAGHMARSLARPQVVMIWVYFSSQNLDPKPIKTLAAGSGRQAARSSIASQWNRLHPVSSGPRSSRLLAGIFHYPVANIAGQSSRLTDLHFDPPLFSSSEIVHKARASSCKNPLPPTPPPKGKTAGNPGLQRTGTSLDFLLPPVPSSQLLSPKYTSTAHQSQKLREMGKPRVRAELFSTSSSRAASLAPRRLTPEPMLLTDTPLCEQGASRGLQLPSSGTGTHTRTLCCCR